MLEADHPGNSNASANPESIAGVEGSTVKDGGFDVIITPGEVNVLVETPWRPTAYFYSPLRTLPV